MAKNKKSHKKQETIPNEVKQVLFRAILDFKSGYELNPSEARHKIDFFESVLDIGEINAFSVSQLFTHFTELQKFCLEQTQNKNHRVIQSLTKDSKIVLDYLNEKFEIVGNSEAHMITERKVA